MAIKFTQSKAYRDLTLPMVSALTEVDALEKFVEARWGSRETVVCPSCGTVERHQFLKRRWQFRCNECSRQFSVTSGTILANNRFSYRFLALILFHFVASPKSLAAHQAHSEFGITQRALYLLLGKVREALWQTRPRSMLHRVIHIDGGHFGGKPRNPRVRTFATSALVNAKLRNRKAAIIPPIQGMKRSPENEKRFQENRRIVLVMRQLQNTKATGAGAVHTRIVIVKAETAKCVRPAILHFVKRRSLIMTDEGHAYTWLGQIYRHATVKHKVHYATKAKHGVQQNQAESYIGRLRRGEYGTFHRMGARYMGLYANEAAWREDIRTVSLASKFQKLLIALMRSGHSRAFRGYCQGKRLEGEFEGISD